MLFPHIVVWGFCFWFCIHLPSFRPSVLPSLLPHSLTHSRTHSLTHSLTGFCVVGVGQCARPRGRMYAPLSLWRPWVSASFAWHCALPRGRMYAPVSLWRPWVSASFAWQAWDIVHCQGVGCTPRCSSGVPRSPLLLRGRRGTMCIAGGFCLAGVGQCALPRGRMFGVPGSALLLRGRHGTMCMAKGSDVRPGVPLAFLGRGRRGTWCTDSLTQSLAHAHSLTHSFVCSFTHSLHATPLHSSPLHFTPLHSTHSH